MGPAGLRPALRCAVVAASLVLAACAGLPPRGPVAPSVAVADAAATPLGDAARASLADAGDARSAFRLLADGEQALEARLALARRAARSLDAQYYLVGTDESGLAFLRALADAGARGVRVRLLVDDLYAGGQDTLLAGLAAHPNVEVRLFNPLAARDGTLPTRVLRSLDGFPRLNRRMHNKLFIADGAWAIAGGRNVADAYFGRSAPANFIDVDVLAAGATLPALAASFDAYWNSPLAWPVQALAGADLDCGAARAAFDAAAARYAGASVPEPGEALGRASVGLELARGRIALLAGEARVVVDHPGRAEAAQVEEGEVAAAVLAILDGAEQEVLVASPYVVPGARTLHALAGASARGVHVALMTNSLATTDEPLAHMRYARHRPQLLASGVELYELMPAAESPATTSPPTPHGSFGRLHAKLAVADGRRLFVGSLNLDRRSERLNTELGLVIESPALAREAEALLRRERLPSSWRVRLAADGRLQWLAPDGAAPRDAEPLAASARLVPLRIGAALLGDDLL